MNDEKKIDPLWDITYNEDIDPEYFEYLCKYEYNNNKRIIGLLTALGNFEDWEYAGGNKGRHNNYFNLKFKKNPDIEMPDHEDFCPCGKDIKENCFVFNKEDGRLIVLGNCCIKRFIPKSGRTCEDCEKPHRNIKINKCNDCKQTTCLKCFGKKKPEYKTCYNCYNPQPKKKYYSDVWWDDDIKCQHGNRLVTCHMSTCN